MNQLLPDGRGATTLNRYLFISGLLGLVSVFFTSASLSAPSPTEAASETQLKQAQKLVSDGNFAAAKGILNRLINQYPRAPEPYNNLAALEALQGNQEAAQSLLEKALRTSPGHLLSYQNLNTLNQNIALQAYKKSLALNTPRQPLQLNTATQISSPEKPTIKFVEKPVEVIKEVVREVDRIVEVPAECPITQAEKASAEKQTAPNDSDPSDVVRSWAKAWSEKDTVRYINHYTRNYSHADNKSHVDWVTLRRQRLAKPKFIRVNVQQLRTQRLSDSSASVQFLQSYQSDTINDSIRKMLILVIEDGQWKIQQELVLR